MKRNGFTLMELLIALAILAVLAALVFPVFTSVRERGKMAQCVSNLRQIGFGMGHYLEDWDNRYPWAASDIVVVREQLRPTIRQTMAAYVPGKAVWRCPSDVGEIRPARPDSYGDTYPPSPLPFYSEELHGASYAYYGFFGTASVDYHRGLAGRRTSEVRKPVSAVCLVEPCPWHDQGNIYGDGGDEVWFRQARMNVLFCDGHVARHPQEEWIKGTDFFKGAP